jgi:uncharacterized protein (UPF0332 family)
MNMDPRAFLALAKRLQGTEKNPEGRRSTVSRAYYAAFIVTSEFFKLIGCKVPDGPQSHELVYNFLNNCGDDVLVKAGTKLNDLRGERINADYKLHKKHIENEIIVQSWVSTADEVIKTLDDCKNGDSQRQGVIAAAVRSYAKGRGLSC